MRKLTARRKNWHLHRMKVCRRVRKAVQRVRYREVVSMWFGDREERVGVRSAPSVPPPVLCFDKNPAATLEFLQRRRVAFARWYRSPTNHKVWVNRPRGRMPWIPSYSDYSGLTEVSTAASLVIAAEYDRAKRLIGAPPPAVNLAHWNEKAFLKLFEMGFFETVGLSHDVADRFNQHGNTRTMRIVTGRDAAALESACLAIQDLSRFIDDDGISPIPEAVFIALNTAISEALANVTRWAYVDLDGYDCPHVDSWWVCATADREHRTLTVVLYDQGITIPITHPRKPANSWLKDALPRLKRTDKFPFMFDGDFIRQAMKPGKSGSDQPWRGNGLPQMVDLIKSCQGGRLLILSRGGKCRYEHGGRLERESFRNSVGGTLIEWTLTLPKGTDDG